MTSGCCSPRNGAWPPLPSRPRQLLLRFSSSVATMCPFAFLDRKQSQACFAASCSLFAGPRGAVSPKSRCVLSW